MLSHAVLWYFWITAVIPSDFFGESLGLVAIIPLAGVILFLIWAVVAVIAYFFVRMAILSMVQDHARRKHFDEKAKLYILRFYAWGSFNAPITLNTFIVMYFFAFAATLCAAIADMLYGAII